MKLAILLLILMLPTILMAQSKDPVKSKPKGVLLEDLTWVEAEKLLNEKSIVVIPVGAASKEHGPHLKLKNDLIMEYSIHF